MVLFRFSCLSLALFFFSFLCYLPSVALEGRDLPSSLPAGSSLKIVTRKKEEKSTSQKANVHEEMRGQEKVLASSPHVSSALPKTLEGSIKKAKNLPMAEERVGSQPFNVFPEENFSKEANLFLATPEGPFNNYEESSLEALAFQRALDTFVKELPFKLSGPTTELLFQKVVSFQQEVYHHGHRKGGRDLKYALLFYLTQLKKMEQQEQEICESILRVSLYQPGQIVETLTNALKEQGIILDKPTKKLIEAFFGPITLEGTGKQGSFSDGALSKKDSLTRRVSQREIDRLVHKARYRYDEAVSCRLGSCYHSSQYCSFFRCGKYGWLASPFFYDNLASQILMEYEDPELRSQLARYVITHFYEDGLLRNLTHLAEDDEVRIDLVKKFSSQGVLLLKRFLRRERYQHFMKAAYLCLDQVMRMFEPDMYQKFQGKLLEGHVLEPSKPLLVRYIAFELKRSSHPSPLFKEDLINLIRFTQFLIEKHQQLLDGEEYDRRALLRKQRQSDSLYLSNRAGGP